MITRSLLLLLFTISFTSTYAQGYLRNLSLELYEDRPLPENWYPGNYGFTMRPYAKDPLAPSDGKYYVFLDGSEFMDDEFKPGAIGQELSNPMDSGKAYLFTVDVANTWFYEYYLDFPEHFNISRSSYGTLMVVGSTNKHEEGEILWQSNTFYHQTWKKYTIYMEPTRTINHLRFLVFKQGTDSAKVTANIDNMTQIIKVVKLKVTAQNTCRDESIGVVSAIPFDNSVSYTYLWTPGNYTTQTVTGLAAGNYHLVIKSSDGGISERDIEVMTSDVTMSKLVTNVSCNGNKDGIINGKSNGGQWPYTWSVNGTPQDNGLFRNLPAGNYKISVADKWQCAASATVTINEPLALQQESISTKGLTCSTSLDGLITLTVSGGTLPYAYSLPGRPAQKDSVLRHLDAGTYHYTISDSHKCRIEGDTYITGSTRECAIFAPSAFSPNGDGLNDIFHVKLLDGFTKFRLAVYGRWGDVVYETNDPLSGWDGTRKGVYLPAGTYTWSVTYTDSKNQLIKQQGNLLMIR